MKLIHSIWICLLCTTLTSIAQSPMKIQGVAYNRQGEALANATLFFKLKIHSDSLNGKLVWSDEFQITTDSKANYTLDLEDLGSKSQIKAAMLRKQTSYYIEEVMQNNTGDWQTVFFQEIFFWDKNTIDTVAPVYQNSTTAQNSLNAIQPNEDNTTINDTAEQDMTEEELLTEQSFNGDTNDVLMDSEDMSTEAMGGMASGNAKNGSISNGNSKGELISVALASKSYLSVNKQERMPEGRVLHKMASVANRLYLVGGYNGELYSKSCWSFDPGQRKWAVLAPMSVARTEHQLHAINNNLYAIGGTDQSDAYLEVYDVSKNEWTPYAAPFKEGRSFFTEAYKNGVYWIDVANEKTRSKLYFFDSKVKTWSVLNTSPEAGRVMWFGLVNEKLSLVLKKQNQTLSVYQMEVSGDWTKLNDLPVRLNQAKLLNLGASIYCIEADSKGKSEKYLFKLEDQEWVRKSSYALYRRDASIVSQHNRIVIIGGEGDQQRHMSLIEYYNPETEQWESSSRLSVGSSKQEACILKETIYISGGHSIKSFTSDRVESLQFY